MYSEVFKDARLIYNSMADEESKDILDDMGITRYCCRRMLISHVETWE